MLGLCAAETVYWTFLEHWTMHNWLQCTEQVPVTVLKLCAENNSSR